jgi:hypothetical protein
MGLEWREADRSPPGRDDVGVYRIGRGGDGPLEYLGQGLVAARWRSHTGGWAADLAAEGDSTDVWDWAGLLLSSNQLLEVENDLIAGHVLKLDQPPRIQFGRSGRQRPVIAS